MSNPRRERSGAYIGAAMASGALLDMGPTASGAWGQCLICRIVFKHGCCVEGEGGPHCRILAQSGSNYAHSAKAMSTFGWVIAD
jgi:hypothetical protein